MITVDIAEDLNAEDQYVPEMHLGQSARQLQWVGATPDVTKLNYPG